MNTLSPKYLQSVAKKDASWVINALKKFSDDRCAAMAASIAFYSAFSLAPTLVMVIAVAGWVFGPEAARGQLFHQVNGMLGDQAAAGVQSIVTNAHRSGESGMAAIVSFVLLLIGASATFSSLNTALNLIWPASGEPKSSVVALVKVRLISLGLVLGVAFLLIVSLVLDTAIQAAGKWLWGTSPLVVVGDIVQFVLGLAILSAAFGALLKFLPDGHVFWRDALVGGLIAAVLFSAGKKLFALYLTHAGTASAFGAAGSLAVLLMWLYFAAAVLLLGAESSAARARKGNPQPRKAPDAITAPTVRGSNDVVPLDPSGATVRVSRPRADSDSLQLRAVRMFSRPLVSAESHATRSAARALIGASRKFSQTNQLVLALGCAVAATAYAQTAPASGSTQGTGVTALSEKLSATDQQFIQAAGESGATEIAASKLALAKSGDAHVKQFAQRMIADHTKLARNLNVISTRYGITSEPSPDSSVIGSLQNLQGADFNKAYIEAVVDGHRKAVALFTKESESGNNAQLKSAGDEGASDHPAPLRDGAATREGKVLSKLAAFAAIHPGCGVERVKDEQAVDADAHEPFVAPGAGGLRRMST